MFIIGCTALCGTDSCIVPHTQVDGIHSIRLQNAVYDEMMMTRNLEYSDSGYPDEWDRDTMLHGTYENGDYNVGNMLYSVKNTSDILIKRREKGSLIWMPIFHKEIHEAKDFDFSFYDYHARSGVTYEYGLSQVLQNIESNLIMAQCFSEFDGCYLAGRTRSYPLLLNLKIDRQKSVPRTYIQGLNKKYPNTIMTSQANYYTGSASATLLRYDPVSCSFDADGASAYRDEFMEFLTDGSAKILKTFSGQCLLINTEDSPSESSSEHWNLPSTSFNWVQVGSTESIKDMVMNGLLDIDPQWWPD